MYIWSFHSRQVKQNHKIHMIVCIKYEVVKQIPVFLAMACYCEENIFCSKVGYSEANVWVFVIKHCTSFRYCWIITSNDFILSNYILFVFTITRRNRNYSKRLLWQMSSLVPRRFSGLRRGHIRESLKSAWERGWQMSLMNQWLLVDIPLIRHPWPYMTGGSGHSKYSNGRKYFTKIYKHPTKSSLKAIPSLHNTADSRRKSPSFDAILDFL